MTTPDVGPLDPPPYSVVVATIGRPGLNALLARLADGDGPLPAEVYVVHDRPGAPLSVQVPRRLRDRVVLLSGAGRGPAAARNVGWRAVTADWVVFLDDDVLPEPGWRAALAADLAGAGDAAAVQGRLQVPLPADRAPTDWERQVAGLAGAPWITADIAYRRTVLAEVDGFDERFPRAYREDTELAIRVRREGHHLSVGARRATHPVGPADRWVSVRRQRGNADDALLRRLYGRRWRALGEVPAGRRLRHAALTAAAVATGAALVARRPAAAGLAVAGWLAGTVEFAWRRIAPGPRTPAEIATMAVTSAVIPPVATFHWLAGWLRHRGARPVPARRANARAAVAGRLPPAPVAVALRRPDARTAVGPRRSAARAAGYTAPAVGQGGGR
jgi:GT2 family glycosyltransferase